VVTEHLENYFTSVSHQVNLTDRIKISFLKAEHFKCIDTQETWIQ